MLFLLAALFDVCLVPCCLPRKQRVQANDTRLSNKIRFMHLQKGILRTHFTTMKLPFREKFPCRRNSDSEQTQTDQKRHQTKRKAAYSLETSSQCPKRETPGYIWLQIIASRYDLISLGARHLSFSMPGASSVAPWGSMKRSSLAREHTKTKLRSKLCLLLVSGGVGISV